MSSPYPAWKTAPLKGMGLVCLALILGVALFGIQPEITGFITREHGYVDTSRMVVASSGSVLWQPQSLGELLSLSIDGALVNNGTAKVWLERNGEKKLVFDSAVLGKTLTGAASEASNQVTGFSIAENTTEKPQQGETVQEIELPIREENNTIPSASTDETASQLNDSRPAMGQLPQESLPQGIFLSLAYGSNPLYDEDNDGIEAKTGVVDFRVSSASDGMDSSKLCTRWRTTSEETGQSAYACRGSSDCCAFVDVAPSHEEWNATYYSTYNRNGETAHNTVAAQLVYYDVNLSPENPHSNILYSDWQELRAAFVSSEQEFFGECLETCRLEGFNSSSYTLMFEIEEGTLLTINRISYRLRETINTQPTLTKDFPNITLASGEPYALNLSSYFSDPEDDHLSFSAYEDANLSIAIDGNVAVISASPGYEGKRFTYVTASDGEYSAYSNFFSVTVLPSAAPIKETPHIEAGKEVKWVKRIARNATDDSFTVAIPKTALNFTIYEVANSHLIEVHEHDLSLVEDGAPGAITEYQEKKTLEKLERKRSLLESAQLRNAQITIDGKTIPQQLLTAELTETAREKNALKQKEKGAKKSTGAIAEISSVSPLPEDVLVLVSNLSAQTRELQLEYFTEAPAVIEAEKPSGVREVIISSDTHYENVSVTVDIPETSQSSITVFWVQNNTRIEFNPIAYLDGNSNGLIDQLSWIVPHLSNQTFEISLQVLNVQSYPIVGRDWEVRFTTSGTANLTITGINGTSYAEMASDNGATYDDLLPSSLSCGNTTWYDINSEYMDSAVWFITSDNQKVKLGDLAGQQTSISSLFVQDYNCDSGTGYWTSHVITPGRHHQQFTFGGLQAEAHNLATINNCTELNIPGETYQLSANLTGPTLNLTGATNGVCFNITANSVTLDCQGNFVNGTDDGSGVYASNMQGITIKNCSFWNWGDADSEAGIYLLTVQNSMIRDVNASFNYYGVSLAISNNNNNNLTNIVANSNSFIGIDINGGFNKLDNLNANSNSFFGIQLGGASNSNTLTNITANSNSFYGLVITGSSNNLSAITSNSNGQVGFQMSSSFTKLTNVTANGNLLFGFYVNGPSNVFSSATANSNGRIGIYGYGAESNTFSNITARSNGRSGISLASNSNSNRFINATIIGSQNGTLLDQSRNNNFTNIYMYNLSVTGFAFSNNPSNNTFFNTVIQNATTGILLDGLQNTFDFLTINATLESAINTNDGAVNATVRNAIISGCVNPQIGGLNNSAGASQLDFNYIANYSCLLGNVSGILNNYSLTSYPFDTTATNGGFYLASGSPAFNAGDRASITAVSPDGSVNLSRYYTTDLTDSGIADLGYHYSESADIPLTSCRELGVVNKYYTLLNNITQPTLGINAPCFNITANSVTLDCQGNFVNGTDDGYGVYAKDVQGITIKNCSFWNWGDADPEAGIYFTNVRNSTIRDMNASINYNGIYLSSSSQNNISLITANSNTIYGFALSISSNSNNLFQITANSNSNVFGLYISSSTYNNFSQITANSNSGGLAIYSSSSNTFTNSSLQNNTNMDIELVATSNNQCDNTFNNVTLSMDQPTHYYNYSVNIENQTLSNLILCNADGSNLTNITVNGNLTGGARKKNNGMLVLLTDNAHLINLNLTNSRIGLAIGTSSSNTFSQVTANSNTLSGLSLSSSPSNTLSNITANYNQYGLYLDTNSNNNTLTDITANSNSQYGLSLSSSSSNNFSQITANSNSNGLYLSFNSNTNNLANITANSNSIGLYLDTNSNNTLTNITANSNTQSGLRLSSSSSNTLRDIISQHNPYSIYISASSKNNLSSVFLSNSSTAGIYLTSDPNNNTFFNILISNVTTGILLDGSENTFSFITINASGTSAINTNDAAVNASFRNILLSSCTKGGLNNTGKSAKLSFDYIANYSCSLFNYSGIFNNYSLNVYPFDQRATNGGFYLNQSLATKDGGDRTAASAVSPDGSFTLAQYYTTVFTDSGTADMGYHYSVAADISESTPPIVNTSLNATAFFLTTILNISANITDDTGLSNATIAHNISGSYAFINYTISGIYAEVSTIPTFTSAGVFNLTVIARDISGNEYINITIITVLDNVAPIVNISFNVTLPIIGTVINFTANVTDETQLFSANWSANLSGVMETLHYALISGTTAKVSNITTFTGAGEFNFTLLVTDTSGNIGQNSALIAVLPQSFLSNCTTLNQTGGIYFLQSNISTPVPSNGVCFNITANSVTLDCQGNFVNGTGDGFGVYAENVQGVTIKNCSFWNWGDSGFEGGIYFTNVGNSTIRKVNVSANEQGIYLLFSSQNNLSQVTTTNNSARGITIIFGYSNSFTNITSNYNSFGFYLSTYSSSLFSNIVANSNRNDGFYLEFDSSSNTFSGITANSNSRYGLYLLVGPSSSAFTNITLSSNGQYGFSISGTKSNNYTNLYLFNNSRGISLSSNPINNTFFNTLIANSSVGILLDGEENTFNFLTINATSTSAINTNDGAVNATIRNAIISGCTIPNEGGLNNSAGAYQFDFNYISNYSCSLGNISGILNNYSLSAYPFDSVATGFYLMQNGASVNAGDRAASAATSPDGSVILSNYYTTTTQDAGAVDLGYHYPVAAASASDVTLPIVNTSFNTSTFLTGTVLNFTANVTDETGVSFGQIIVNDTGDARFFNFSLGGALSAQFSQNITVSCSICIINVTARVNDTSNNWAANSTLISIVHIENLTISLNDTSVYTSDMVYVYGRINLSNGTYVANGGINLFVNGTIVNATNPIAKNITESSDDVWNLSVLNANVSINPSNLSLKRNSSSQYPNQTGSFTSRVIDGGSVNTNFTSISWAPEGQYKIELGRSSGDGINAVDGSSFINTSGLVLLMHFNNEWAFGEIPVGPSNKTYDFSVDANSDRSSSRHNNGTVYGATFNGTNYKFGEGAYYFDGSGDYIDAGNDPSLNITGALTMVAWVKSNSEGYVIVKDPVDDSGTTTLDDSTDCFDIDTQTTLSPDHGPGDCDVIKNVDFDAGADGMGVDTGSADFASITCNPTDGRSYVSTQGFPGIGGGLCTSPTVVCFKSSSEIYAKLKWTTGCAPFATADWTITYDPTGPGGGGGKTDVPFALSTINGGQFLIRNNSLNYAVNASANINDGNWHHLASTFDGTEMRLYIDGNLNATSNSYSGNLPSNSYNVWIGRNYSSTSSTGHFNGGIDEVGIWNRTLSANEISKLYQRGVLTLNVSVRSCDDPLCSGESFSEVLVNSSGTNLNASITPQNRYFQYKAVFNTDDVGYAPLLHNVTVDYTTLATDSFGRYNFTFTAPSYIGTYTLKVNTTFNGMYGENSINLTVTDATPPSINASLDDPVPGIYQRVNMTANVSDNIGVSFCQFIDNQSLPNGAKQFINISVTGIGSQCSQNYTIKLPAGNVINFTVIVNDTAGNMNQSRSINNAIGQVITIGTETRIRNCENLTVGNLTYALARDTSSEGTCFNILANNITLDCKGFEINYSQSVVGYGVNNSGFNYSTIRNCNIVQADIAGDNSDAYGVYVFRDVRNNIIHNNTIITLGSNGYGVYLFSQVYGTSIYNNNITTEGSAGYGVALVSTAYNNSVYGNTIATSGFSLSIGVILSTTAYNNHVYSNVITTSGFSNGEGVRLISTAYNNSIYRNNITTGTSNGDGVYLGLTVYNNDINSNIITTGGSNADGVLLQSTVYNNSVYSNIISINGVDSRGVVLDSIAYNNNVYSNNITTNGGGGDIGTALEVTSTVSNNLVFGNNITTNGNYRRGITLSINAYNNTFYDNRITTNHPTGSYGVYLLQNVNNNTFYRNTISSLAIGIVINGTGQTAAQSTKFNTFTNDTIIPCSIGCAADYSDIKITSNVTDIIFTNVFLNKSRILFVPASPEIPVEKNNLTVKWYLAVNVTNSSNNNRIEGVEVNINDSFAANVFSGLSGVTGYVTTIDVTEFTMNGSIPFTSSTDTCTDVRSNINITCFTPHNISVNLTGYNKASYSIDVNRSKFVNIPLTIMDSISPIVNTFFNTSTFLIGTVLNFSANITDETQLLSANISYNMSGFITYANYTISGTSITVYNITTLAGVVGDVINFTFYATDASNNVKQNSTLITIATPSIIELKLTSTPSGNKTTSNIYFSYNYTGDTGTEDHSFWQWYLNNVSVNGSTKYKTTGSFSTIGSGNTNLWDVTFANNFFWTTDNFDDEVYQYTSSGTYTGTHWDTAASGNNNPIHITFANNNFWITDGTSKVYKYTSNGTYTGTSWNINGVNGDPQGITFANNFFWIVDSTDDEVYQYTSSGTYTGTHWDTAASGNTLPYGITYANGNFWVTDDTDNQVYQYTSNGTYTRSRWDTSVASGNAFPSGITYANGNFWVSDFTTAAIFNYNSELINNTQTSIGDQIILQLTPSDSIYNGTPQNISMVINGPVIRGALNKSTSSIYQSDIINATFNVTDAVSLSNATISINDTGETRYFNFSLSGNSEEFSQNFTISCSVGCVVNITGWANDTLGIAAQNETIFTITTPDMIPPIVNSSFNTSTFVIGTVLNFSANITDETALRNATWSHNISGSYVYVNYTLIGTSAQLSNATTLPSVGVFNFSITARDTSGNEKMNSTLITALDSTPPIINTSFNISAVNSGHVLNFSSAMTDETELQLANISNNMTGGVAYSVILLSGTSAQISNLTAISAGVGTVINFSITAEDTSNNLRQNSTIITVVDTIAPTIALNTPTNTPTFGISEFTINISVSSDTAACSYAINGSANVSMAFSSAESTCVSPQAEMLRNSLYNLTFYANDTAGNAQTLLFFLNMSDTTPSNAANGTHASVGSITASTAQVSISDMNESVNVSINQGAVALASSPLFNRTHSLSLAGLSASTVYTLNITVCDYAGNCISNDSVAFTTSAVASPPAPDSGGGSGGGGGGGGAIIPKNVSAPTSSPDKKADGEDIPSSETKETAPEQEKAPYLETPLSEPVETIAALMEEHPYGLTVGVTSLVFLLGIHLAYIAYFPYYYSRQKARALLKLTLNGKASSTGQGRGLSKNRAIPSNPTQNK